MSTIMQHGTRWWLGAAAALSCGATVALAQDEGRVAFTSYGCFQCHGYEGQGEGAPRLAAKPYTLEAFATFVRKPPNEMPAYARSVLSDATLESIYRYVRAIPEPPPADR
jgi:ubiquinol-cytochrome c reductase cytochrome c subunit